MSVLRSPAATSRRGPAARRPKTRSNEDPDVDHGPAMDNFVEEEDEDDTDTDEEGGDDDDDEDPLNVIPDSSPVPRRHLSFAPPPIPSVAPPTRLSRAEVFRFDRTHPRIKIPQIRDTT